MRRAHCGSILCPVVSEPATIRFDSSRGRWVIATAVVGSGIAFLDSTVVNTALPAIQAEPALFQEPSGNSSAESQAEARSEGPGFGAPYLVDNCQLVR